MTWIFDSATCPKVLNNFQGPLSETSQKQWWQLCVLSEDPQPRAEPPRHFTGGARRFEGWCHLLHADDPQLCSLLQLTLLTPSDCFQCLNGLKKNTVWNQDWGVQIQMIHAQHSKGIIKRSNYLLNLLLTKLVFLVLCWVIVHFVITTVQ